MTALDLDRLEGRVRTWLQQTGPVTTDELLEQHRSELEAFSAEAVRRAVWNLVGSGEANFDHAWRVALRR